MLLLRRIISLEASCNSVSSFIRGCSGMKLPTITMFTKRKEHCSLCDSAKEVLCKYSTKFIYEEIYIDDPENSHLYDKYKHDIPVIHMNGQYLMKHRVNEDTLRQALDNKEILTQSEQK